MTDTVVIAGAGHAAGQVVATLKQKKFSGRIVLVGDESYLPYQRPPLSKKYLAGELLAERLHFKPASFYDDPQIDVRLNTHIDKIDRPARLLVSSDGSEIAYDQLILAVGSRVRKLQLAGVDLDGVHYLRTINDVDTIRDAIEPGKHMVIIGAGYIGLEVAAVCRQLGLDVTVIEMADRVMSRVVSTQVSEFYQRQHASHGVKLLLSTGLVGFEGSERGGVTAVAIDDGRSIPADLVVIGIGILPNTELAAAASLDVDNGIVVDDRCQTSDSRIYAVGDCTAHPSALYGRRLRLESVHNALEQAKTVASNLCGDESTYAQLPWFWSDQYDLKLQIAGLSNGYDQVVIRGDSTREHFSGLYLKDKILIAVDAINEPRDFVQSKALIAARAVIDPQRLADTGIALKELL